MTNTKPYIEDEDELLAAIQGGSDDQRLALALGGVTVAILQEQRRMGFTDQDVATILAMDHDGEVDQKLYAVFLDFQGAFDGVPHGKLRNKLHGRFGISGKLPPVIMDLFSYVTGMAAVNEGIT